MSTIGKNLFQFESDGGELSVTRITSQYLWPFKEEVTRFDFEVAAEDEHMCEFMAKSLIGASGLATPSEDESYNGAAVPERFHERQFEV